MSWDYSRVRTKIWDDERVRSLSERGERVFFYLLTTSQGNGLGYFRFSPGKAAEDLRLSASAFGRAFAEVQQVMGWRFDPDARVMLLPKFFKYNTADNPNCLKSWMKELANIPASPLFEEFARGEQFLPEGQRSMFREALDLYGPKRTGERMGEPSPEPSAEGFGEPSGEGRGEPSSTPNPIPKPKPNTTQTPPPAVLEMFEKFWSEYPARDGRKLHKKKALKKWLALSEEDRTKVSTALRNYVVSPATQRGFGIKDPHGWLRDKDGEPWRDWLDPPVATAARSINDKNFRKGVW